jgi:DNA oxidative demethylase
MSNESIFFVFEKIRIIAMAAWSGGFTKIKCFECDESPLKPITDESLTLKLRLGHLCSKRTADELFKALEKDTEYYSAEDSKIYIRGHEYYIPREQVAYGEQGISYTFNENTVIAKPWTPTLRMIKIAVERKLEVENPFNFALVNRYKDGYSSIGLHQDDERDLVARAPIASVSLGEPRRFCLEKIDGKVRPVQMMLNHGSLLSMDNPTNLHWRHCIPKDPKVRKPRINITFRLIQNERR